jgi:transcriptional regulator with XRE-family HTH domain
MTGHEGVGDRVAEHRKLRGLTQAQLSRRSHVSLSLLRKVEQGAIPASPAFTAAVAGALGMSVAELYDQPQPRFGAEREHVSAVETAILEGTAVGVEPNSDDLAAAVDRVLQLQRKSRYRESSGLLPGLLRQLNINALTAEPGAASEIAHNLLATTYSAAMICLHRLGSPLAGLAAERATDAARGSGDPLLAAITNQDRSLALLTRGSYGAAERIVAASQQQIADQSATAPVCAVRGAMHLRSAMIAARAGDRQGSDAHLTEARDLAYHVPTVGDTQVDYYDTAFSTTNVAIHAVAAAVEMYDGTTAVTRNEAVPPPSTTIPSRMAHHHIDLGRAWLLHGDRNRALASLNTARQLAPQQTRYHPQVAETVTALAQADKRRSDSLANFVAWLGITA